MMMMQVEQSSMATLTPATKDVPAFAALTASELTVSDRFLYPLPLWASERARETWWNYMIRVKLGLQTLCRNLYTFWSLQLFMPSCLHQPLFSNASKDAKTAFRRIPVPPHRITPLRRQWLDIYTPLVDHMKLQVRMNVKSRAVELRTCELTTDPGAVQKGADFVKAYTLGFDIPVCFLLVYGFLCARRMRLHCWGWMICFWTPLNARTYEPWRVIICPERLVESSGRRERLDSRLRIARGRGLWLRTRGCIFSAVSRISRLRGMRLWAW